MGESYDAVVDIFECIENFLRRLSIYNEITPTPAMAEMVIKIMAELITVLALATKQMKQGRFSTYPGPLLMVTFDSPRRREIRKKNLRRKRHRVGVSQAR